MRIELSSIREFEFKVYEQTGKITHADHKNGEYVHLNQKDTFEAGNNIVRVESLHNDMQKKLITSNISTQTEFETHAEFETQTEGDQTDCQTSATVSKASSYQTITRNSMTQIETNDEIEALPRDLHHYHNRDLYINAENRHLTNNRPLPYERSGYELHDRYNYYSSLSWYKPKKKRCCTIL